MKRYLLMHAMLGLFILMLALFGCNGGSKTPTGAATLNIDWPTRSRLAVPQVESVTLTIMSGTSTIATHTVDRPSTAATSSMTLPSLPMQVLLYTATAYSQPGGTGTPLAEGAGTVKIATGQSNVIALSLISPITKLIVSPSAPTIKIRQILQMVASAKNSANQTVLVPMNSINWSSGNTTSVAVIDTRRGIIKGNAAGKAIISAVESTSGVSGTSTVTVSTSVVNLPPIIVLGYSELGMHCMNQDFSEMMILPPFNTMHATVIDRSGEDPRIVRSGITVNYNIPSNTYSVGKTNFWSYVNPLLGVTLAPNIGLAGNGLKGSFTPPVGTSDSWQVTGIPLTPITDAGVEDAYQLSNITVVRSGVTVSSTQAVVPVSWEISCNICHKTPGISTATDILRAHDRLHPEAGKLVDQKPVTCGKCHAQPPLGMAGKPGVLSLSGAMHSTHSTRMAQANLAVSCYACHPGIRTKCQRDIHYSRGMNCLSCHVSMAAVGNPARKPWVDEPRCDSCHKVTGHQYEQPATLYRNSRGHMGIHCAACHNSPHAITPTVVNADNVQAIQLQGHAGTINTCTVCHREKPDEAFPHKLSD